MEHHPTPIPAPPPRAGLCMAAAAATLILAACGGGGGGEPPPPPPPPPPPSGTSRHASIGYDFDNDGNSDAVETISYDANGRPTETRYTYTGDATADRFGPWGTDNGTQTISYDASGRVLVYAASEAEGSFSFVYDANGLAERADFTGSGGGQTSEARFDLSYTAGLLTRRVTVVQGQVLEEVTYENDAAGRRTVALTADGQGGSTVSSQYVWNADGTLASATNVFDADGADPRYELSYDAAGSHTGTLKTVAGRPLYSVAFVYDDQGRLSQARFDNGVDGSVDAVVTVSWEDGVCTDVVFPLYEPLIDTISGRASVDGTLEGCHR